MRYDATGRIRNKTIRVAELSERFAPVIHKGVASEFGKNYTLSKMAQIKKHI